jgi:hypothetical protein
MVFKYIFGFLLSSSTLKSLNDHELEEGCNKFAYNFSPEKGPCDVEVYDLISELKMMIDQCLLWRYFSMSRIDCYPNISIAYRILFTVTVASAERSFSKLKLLKNYLRSTMSQQKLNGLATLCIEKKLLDDVDIDPIITEFASRNVIRNF